MATLQYNPTLYKPPALPKITSGVQPPATTVNNIYAKSILDNLGKNLKPVRAYTDQYNLNDSLFPSQELGNQFIQQALLPEFQQNVYNPFQRQLSDRFAGSNAGLLGSASRYVQDQNRRVTQPFFDQSQSVLDMFTRDGYNQSNEDLKNYYNANIGF